MARDAELLRLMLNCSPTTAKAKFLEAYPMSNVSWCQYLQRAQKAIREGGEAFVTGSDVFQSIVMRHLDNYDGADRRTRVKILAELSKLTGAYAPVTVHQETTILDAGLQAALIDDTAMPIRDPLDPLDPPDTPDTPAQAIETQETAAETATDGEDHPA